MQPNPNTIPPSAPPSAPLSAPLSAPPSIPIDISRPISPLTLVYPGDPPLVMQPLCTIGPDSPCRMTTLHWTTHLATHLDAPAHFIPGGATLDQIPLDRFRCPALVIEVSGNVIEPQHIPSEESTRDRALLFRTRHSREGYSAEFDQHHVYMNAEAANLAALRGANLIGIDYLSIDRHGDPNFPAHYALLGANILILEGLDLQSAPAGTYTLTAYPLKIENADGSPVRAVLEK